MHAIGSAPYALAFLLVAAYAGDAPPAAAVPAVRDITFIVTSDCHYDAFENEDRNGRDRETVMQMNWIERTDWPEKLGGGAIGMPRGVLVLGDVIDDGDRAIEGQPQSARQWGAFVNDFGLDGTDGILMYPVFEGWGNHDGPPAGSVRLGFSMQAELAARNRIRLQKGLIGGLSANGLHYSWDWDDVHFVHTNLYPADRQNPKVKYSAVWHDPQGALTFLKEDLAARVGASGRPVIVVSHCGFDTDWWNAEDWQAFYEALAPYRVILYFFGHSGTGVWKWAPPGATTPPLDCVNTGQTENGFFLVHIAGDRVRLAYRTKSWQVRKGPDGKDVRSWQGAWEWRWPFEKSLAAPAGK